MKIFFIIVVCFIVLTTGSALRESLTYDEIVHLQEGYNHLVNHTFAIDTNNPPLVRELAAIPFVMGIEGTLPARLVIVALATLLVILVYLTTKRYFGQNSALLAALLLSFEPTFLAHSHYVTLDVGAAFFIFHAYLVFLEFLRRHSFRNALFLGIASGFAFASRIQSLIFLPISIAIISIVNFRKLQWGKIIVACMVSVLTIWLTYSFRSDVVVAQRQDPNRVSSRIMQTNNSLLRNLILVASVQPIPLGNYLATIKNSLVRSTQKAKHSLYELPVNFILKTPIPFLIFIVLGLRSKKVLLFFIPAAVIISISSLVPLQPWVRYVIPSLPFLAIVAGRAIGEVKGKYMKLGILLLLIWYIVGTLVQFPNFISYANELAGPRDKRFEKLNDSNLDWGQSLPDLKRYIDKKKPEHASFSYFGRDNGNLYGLISNRPYGSHKFEEICAFHEIDLPKNSGSRLIAISATNWYQCGFSTQQQFHKDKIKDVVADTILIF